VGSDADHAEASFFDCFAEAASELASHASFFIACVVLVVVWAPSYFLIGNLNAWQLIINTARRSSPSWWWRCCRTLQRRNENAFNQKLDALADGLADLMEHVGATELEGDIDDLRAAVGVEKPE
jgi:cytochrome c-type biogenesis protein CcmH/NrfG